jgi:hypothetical protein
MMPAYTTAERARAEADLLPLADGIGIVPACHLMLLRNVVANPATSSDMLLILADGLRDAAAELAQDGQFERRAALMRLAGSLSDLAPWRADPL